MHTQRYDLYTPVEHSTWSVLYSRQIKAVERFAYPGFINGIRQLEFTPERIPDFNRINPTLRALTGWGLYGVPGLIENAVFFQQLHAKKFAATTWIRKPEQLDYLEEPDMFHDVFGHVPLLTDPAIATYLSGLAALAISYLHRPEIIEAIARLYWYTIEFGLIRTDGELKIYGAGILSSIAETAYCFSDKPSLEPFNLQKIIDTPYIKDNFQEQYFVLESPDELAAALPGLKKIFETAG